MCDGCLHLVVKRHSAAERNEMNEIIFAVNPLPFQYPIHLSNANALIFLNSSCRLKPIPVSVCDWGDIGCHKHKQPSMLSSAPILLYSGTLEERRGVNIKNRFRLIAQKAHR